MSRVLGIGATRVIGTAIESVLTCEVTYVIPPQPRIYEPSCRRGKGEKKRAAKQRRLHGGF